jgi:hypothetical protein
VVLVLPAWHVPANQPVCAEMRREVALGLAPSSSVSAISASAAGAASCPGKVHTRVQVPGRGGGHCCGNCFNHYPRIGGDVYGGVCYGSPAPNSYYYSHVELRYTKAGCSSGNRPRVENLCLWVDGKGNETSDLFLHHREFRPGMGECEYRRCWGPGRQESRKAAPTSVWTSAEALT